MKKPFLTLLTSAALALPLSLSASNVTSITLDLVEFGNLTGLSVSDVNQTASPSPLYALGFEVDLGSVLPTMGGTLEHSGSSITFDGTVTVGDFSIGFDLDRDIGLNSGYFVKDTLNDLVLFDVTFPQISLSGNDFSFGPSLLLISSELESFLGKDQGSIAGSLVGMFRVDAMVDDGVVIPEASTYALILGLGALGFILFRRRKA
ncbi:MAG: PEP-CTERM sorting domain-containing protein [Puniceicoccaceae bacterium]|nr:MAG: PEP-CTERM sorting domain-containing protein [Puniceicoccaceae bacterium]